MRIKRSILAIVLVGSSLGIFAQAAAAAPPSIRCTDSYEPARASQFEIGDTVDKNQNGWVCAKQNPGGGNEGLSNIIDDKK